jgi:hypothetical protein
MVNIGKKNRARCPERRLHSARNVTSANPKSKGSTVIGLLKAITVLALLALLTARMLVSCIKLNP